MRNPLGAQDRFLGGLDRKRRALASLRPHFVKEESPHPEIRSARIAGSPVERSPLERRLDPGNLLSRALKKPAEFDQLRALVIEIAREYKDGKLEALARRTLSARLDMQSLQDEARRCIKNWQST